MGECMYLCQNIANHVLGIELEVEKSFVVDDS